MVGQKSVSLKYLNLNSELEFELSSSFVAHSDEKLVEEGGHNLALVCETSCFIFWMSVALVPLEFENMISISISDARKHACDCVFLMSKWSLATMIRSRIGIFVFSQN